MSADMKPTSRRVFFLRGGAVLGAGVATSVGAGAVAADAASLTQPHAQQIADLRARLAGLEDREAIRQIHLAFTAMVESGNPAAAAELFDDDAQLRLGAAVARGKAAIRDLIASQGRGTAAGVVHSAYRHGAAQAGDAVTLDAGGLSASAVFQVQAELCTPLSGDCTAAQMARLQGNVADRRWEAGRFDAKYVRTQGQWKLASLAYHAV